MKIAVIAAPYIAVPPPMYGGAELVVYNLVEGLHEQGHEVILFAPKQSQVSCQLVPYLETALYFGLDSSIREKRLVGELSSKYAYARAGYEKVDIIHDHKLAEYSIDIPVVHTLHGPANEMTVKKCVDISRDPKSCFVPISNRQKELYLELDGNINFASTVYNSVEVNKIEWCKDKEDFFLFIGRANWEKGLDLAVRVASKAKVGLAMAVKMSEDFEKEFFKKEIKPWIDKFPKDLHFEFLEEITGDIKFDLYRRAKCTLFTSQWEEPFGLVMIESMACGTPAIALRRGAAPEVIIDGKTGFIVDTEEEMIEAMKEVDKIDPEDCRKHVENNFSKEKMVRDYLAVYEKMLS
ncbi:glycosyltransferase family 4 protein [Elusimicrobiota bacterium]